MYVCLCYGDRPILFLYMAFWRNQIFGLCLLNNTQMHAQTHTHTHTQTHTHTHTTHSRTHTHALSDTHKKFNKSSL
jgi:hypothetical protein